MDELYFEKSKSTYESALHNIGQKKRFTFQFSPR